MDQLYSEQSDRILRIIINRPDKLNAFTPEMVEELCSILEATRADPTTSVVVIKGVGRAFSTGHDLDTVYATPEPYAIPSATGQERRRGFRDLGTWFSLLWDLPQPVIAQVQGYCFNWALELAMNSDFVIASRDAKFVHRSVGGAARQFALWPWLIGPRKAKEFGMLGEYVSGEVAEQLGMINRCVSEEDLDTEVSTFASRLAKVPLELLALEKKSVNVSLEMMNIRTALGYTMELHTLSHLSATTVGLSEKMKKDGWREAWAERDQERYDG